MIVSITSQDKKVLLQKCFIAQSFLSKVLGFIGKKNISLQEGILFKNTYSIHMWFMSAHIDAVFLLRLKEDSFKVVSFKKNLKPWRFFPVANIFATDVLETASGFVDHKLLKIGDIIEIHKHV